MMLALGDSAYAVAAEPLLGDDDRPSRRQDDRSQVVLIGCDNAEPSPLCHEHHVHVDHITRARPACQRADVVRVLVGEEDDVAAAQELA